MGSAGLVFDPEKHLFSVGVVLTYANRQKAIEMFVDTGAAVSMIALGDALDLGIDVASLPTTATGGVTRIKYLRTIEKGKLSILVGADKLISPQVRISEPIKEEKTRRKGPMVQKRVLTAQAMNLFGLDSVRECRGRIHIDASVDPPAGMLEWD